jgi:hypothetical protein
MNKTLNTTLLVTLILILAVGVFFAGTVYARSTNFGMWSMMGGYGRGRMTNMMGNFNQDATTSYGPGGMMRGNGGMNMMRGYGYNNSDLTPLTIEQATSAAQKYLANLENDDLQIAEVMIFDKNAYIVVKEKSTGTGAFELLADASSQTAYPEHGPNMMWNVKYGGLNHEDMMGNSNGMMGGMMSGKGGMMGGFGWDASIPADASAELTVSPEQAIKYAQTYLDANISGAVAETDPINFYGYYTLDFEKDGKVAGMLSVNGYSGQIFLHTWHGTFIEESEIQ